MNVEEEIENLLVGGEIVDVVQAQPVILLLVPETSLVVGPTSEEIKVTLFAYSLFTSKIVCFSYCRKSTVIDIIPKYCEI